MDFSKIFCALPATVYFGAVEIRNWQIAGQEQVITYPHPAVRLVNGSTITAASYLHRDALGSVRAITDAAGAKVESAVYKPFGEQTEWLSPAAPAPEAKGWIGERYDASAGLQYLNARYYDPELGMFLQPDWFEVTQPGVGRNRYSYSFNDPVNGRDPGGNEVNKKQSGTADDIIKVIDDHFEEKRKDISLADLAYTEGALGGGRQKGPFGGETGMRYVYTEKYGWIDMAHFTQAAAQASEKIGLGSYIPGAYYYARNRLWEYTTQVENAQGQLSKWSFEDAPSNLAGLDYYWEYYTGDKTLRESLIQFLFDAGATAPENSPIWDRVPTMPQTRRVFEDNRSFAPMYNPGPYNPSTSATALAPLVSTRPKPRVFP